MVKVTHLKISNLYFNTVKKINQVFCYKIQSFFKRMLFFRPRLNILIFLPILG